MARFYVYDGSKYVPAGADGKSAYQYAQEGGYTGTETEFAKKLASEVMIVTITESNGTLSANKSFIEIKNAIVDGIPVLVDYGGTGLPLMTMTADALYFGATQCDSGDASNAAVVATLIIEITQNGEVNNISAYVETLPNPNAITFTGAVTGSYDGSAPMSVNIPTVPTKTSQITNDSGFLTSHQDISGKQDKATLEADVAAKGFTKNTGTYSKPAGGIPKADLAEEVQTSLGKVAALQSKSITDTGDYFTTDTVEGALQEIGAELAGINTLLGSGIQISFTIDGDPFSAVSGETWKEWVGTSRVISGISGLTLYCYSDDGIIFADEAGVNALGLNDVWVHGNETIVPGATYAIIPCGG